MHALVFNRTEELGKIEVKDRFDFEDTYLNAWVPSRPCREYREPHPSPQGVHVFRVPGGNGLEARPYLEFEKLVRNETHFQVMQEGQPTGVMVVLD
ncbi:MAG: hypothetical protein P4L11_16445 [Geothrix sp.]|nr:hypothetical protein [Geothrix sp.]